MKSDFEKIGYLVIGAVICTLIAILFDLVVGGILFFIISIFNRLVATIVFKIVMAVLLLIELFGIAVAVKRNLEEDE